MMNKFSVIDFRFALSNDEYDDTYKQAGAWSRLYEYKYVTDFIDKYKHKSKTKPDIHNSSWGFEGIHVTFYDELNKIGNCVHSDIINSDFRDTTYYDITEESKEYKNKFDFVLNVSVIEHLETSEQRLTAVENLYKQVKKGGYLILTFDYPRVNLEEFETLVGSKCVVNENLLNGETSVLPNNNYKDLNIVYLILQKNE